MNSKLKDRKTNQSGQVLIEYLLVMAVAAGITLQMSKILKTGLRNYWSGLATMIAANCPTQVAEEPCAPTPAGKLTIE